MNSQETTKHTPQQPDESETPTYRGEAYQKQTSSQQTAQLNDFVSPVSTDEKTGYKKPRTDHVAVTSPFAVGGDEDSSVDRIYLSLDSILDTKLGCIAQHNPELATALLKKGKWSTRLNDNWPGMLTNKQFREWYDARDIETLKHSVLTNMNFFLKRLIKDNITHTVHTRTNDRVVFELNIWPYKSPDEEFIEMLVECIRFHSYSAASIVVISAEPKDLTPEYVRSRYKVVVMLDYIAWIKTHSSFFEKRGIPEVILVAPAVLDDSADFAEMKKQKITPSLAIDETTKLLQSLINLRPHPISLFCITEAITKDTAKEIVEKVSVTQQDIEQHILKIDPDAVITEVPLNRELPIDLASEVEPGKEDDGYVDPFTFEV